MENQLSECKAKAAEVQDAFLRAKAESENTRRRAQEDITRAHKFAIESFAESLMPVKDNLEMTLKIETLSLESLKEGVEMTLKQLCAAFEKNRLLEIFLSFVYYVNFQDGAQLNYHQHSCHHRIYL